MTEHDLNLENVGDVIQQVKQPLVLGYQLLPEDKILPLDRDNKKDHSRLAYGIADAWLDPELSPTWKKLEEALRTKSVDESTLAEKVKGYSEAIPRRESAASTNDSILTSSMSSCSMPSPFSPTTFEFSGSRSGSIRATTVENGAMELTSLVRCPQPQTVQQPATETAMQDVTTYGCNMNHDMIEVLYWKLTRMVCDKLTSLEVSVKEMRNFVADLHNHKRTVVGSIKRSSTIGLLFSAIKKNNLWTFQHYNLLYNVIKMFGTRDAKVEMMKWMKEYIVNYNGYSAAEKIIEAIPRYYDRAKQKMSQSKDPRTDLSFDEEDLEMLGKSLSIHIRISNESIQYIDDLWSEIAARFRIPSLTAYLYSILHGSVIVTWLIPPGWACCILGEVQGAGDLFKRLHISLVELDSVCIYDEENGISDNEVICSLWLHQASASGEIRNVMSVLHKEEGMDINKQLCIKGEGTALMVAAKYGHLNLVEFYLNNGSDSSIQAEDTGQSALFLAAKEGYSDVVELLSDDNPDLISEKDKNGYSPLMVAAEGDHYETVQILLKHGETVSMQSSAFLLATKKGHFLTVKVFLDYGADTTTTTEDEKTALMLAAESGHSQIFETLLSFGDRKGELDLDSRDQAGKTALMLAAEGGHAHVVNKILDNDQCHFDVDAQDSTGKTALFFASEKGQLDVVELLLKYKADTTIQDTYGKTALDIANTNKHEKVAIVLKATLPLHKRFVKAAKSSLEWIKRSSLNSKLISACKRGALEEVRDCLDNNADPDYRDILDIFRWTSLMWASHRGHKDVVKLLLEKKADPNIQDKNKWSALILAGRRANYEVVQVLVDHGAEVNMQNEDGWTALMWTSQSRGKKNTTEEALKNRRETAKILIAKDADVNLGAKDGWTPVMQASQDGHAGLVAILAESKADLECVNKKEWSSLMIASKHRRVDVLKALVKGGANVEHQKPDGMTAFHISSSKGYADCLKVMATPISDEHKVNVDIKDKWGMTPLILATKHGHEAAAKVLVDAGADVNIHSEKYAGWSALFFAMKGGYLEIVKLLLNNKANMNATDENKQTPLGVALSMSKKGLYSKLLSFLREKPQVLKAITSGPETETQLAQPTQDVSKTPTGDKPAGSDEAPTVTPPLTEPELTTPSLEPAAAEPGAETTLKKLIEEAERSRTAKSAKHYKELEREWQSHYAQAMMSGSRAAGAA